MNPILKDHLPAKPILVSACLLGVCCTYRGDGNPHPAIISLLDDYTLIPVCPEQLGGLQTPRTPAEIRGNGVWMKDGTDVTEQFQRGAEEALRIATLYGCEVAILKQRSPSCGNDLIYDGSHSGVVIEGAGITVRKLRKAGILVFSEDDL
jgi:uncharacterized protein YbbK (DUF523 family)